MFFFRWWTLLEYLQSSVWLKVFSKENSIIDRSYAAIFLKLIDKNEKETLFTSYDFFSIWSVSIETKQSSGLFTFS